jgi:hypothetical protein
LRGRFEAGDVSRSAVIAGEVERAAARLARADAVAKAQQALGQLEEALQSPVVLSAEALQLSIDPKLSQTPKTP